MRRQKIVWFVFAITKRKRPTADWSANLLYDDAVTATISLRGDVGVNVDVNGAAIAIVIPISSPFVDDLDAPKDNADIHPVG